jgi:DNA-binding IclR family transcriptional regulator
MGAQLLLPNETSTGQCFDMAESAEAPSSVGKACRILRTIAHLQQARLTDIAQATGLDKATVLRLLETLAREGFVVRDPDAKLYRGGPELQLAGAAALARSDPRAAVRPSLVRLAGVFEDTAILSIPSGSESMCVDLELGRYPIRANYLEIGSRRLLGVGAGSLALLAFMPERERDAALDVVVAQLGRTQRYPRIDRALLQAKIGESVARGHVVLLDVVVERMGGIAVPIMGPDGRPVAAISIAALSDRIVEREAELAGALAKEAALCQALLHRGAAAAVREEALA